MLLQGCHNQSLPLHLCITSAFKNSLTAQVFMEIENNIKRHDLELAHINSMRTSEEIRFFSIQNSVAKGTRRALLHASGELISKMNAFKPQMEAKEIKTPFKEKPAWAVFWTSELAL